MLRNLAKYPDGGLNSQPLNVEATTQQKRIINAIMLTKIAVLKVNIY